MNKKIETKSKFDSLKWVVVILLIAAAIVGNYVAIHLAIALKLIAWIVVLGTAAAIVATTAKGQLVIEYAKESHMELKKVVWPTRQETVQTTMIVVVMVAILGLLLWGVDSSLLWIVGKVTHIS